MRPDRLAVMTGEQWTNETWLGLILWVLIFYPVWSPRCHRIRKAQRAQPDDARSSTVTQAEKMLAEHKGLARKTGDAWEQDKPYDECFDTDDRKIEDDL